MEKYRSTADPSTGIHPFLPSSRPISPFRLILRPFFLCLRLPIFLILLPAYLILTLIPTLLSPIPFLAYPLHRFLDYILLRPLLLCFGVWIYHYPILQRPRVRTSTSTSTSSTHPSRGDIIISNHASPLDLLYLTAAYSPQYLLLTPTGVVSLSMYNLLTRIGCAPPEITKMSSDLTTVVRKAKAPVILLAEGATSNGKGVLSFPQIQSLLEKNGRECPSTRVFGLGISYSNDKRETFTLGSKITLFFRLLTEPACTIKARVTAIPVDAENVQMVVASLAGVPPLRVSADLGRQFVKHWERTNEGK